MKFIPTKTHGFVDYLVGMLLLVMPWIIRVDIVEPPGMILVGLGILNLVYSLFTRYELGIIPIIPMPVHLALDMLSGLVLALSPWLFGFSDQIFLPYLILGIFEIVASLLTKTTTEPNNFLYK